MDKLFSFPHYKIIASEIGNIEPERHYHFFTWGRWSMHDLLLYLLSFSGPAKVTITSFSLSDITIRLFANATIAGYIKQIDLLLNTAVKRNKTDLLLFAGNVVNKIGLANTHMKIIIIQSDKLSIAVNQSANSTINPAYEAGVICTYANIVNNVYVPAINSAFEKSMILHKHGIIN
jgi:hypothetical protein